MHPSNYYNAMLASVASSRGISPEALIESFRIIGISSRDDILNAQGDPARALQLKKERQQRAEEEERQRAAEAARQKEKTETEARAFLARFGL